MNKLGGLIGEKADGTFEYVGEPDEIDVVKKRCDKECASDKYATMHLFDASRHPCLCVKCAKKGKK